MASTNNRLPLESLLKRERLPASVHQTIERVCKPLALRIADAVRNRHQILIVGLCGPQGSGKTTLALIVQALLQAQSIQSVVMSLDDLYLTRAEREILAQRVHPLLRTRGVPGTHDVALGLLTIEALSRGEPVSLPAFEKAKDDRSPVSAWRSVTGVTQVVLFEGWCVGATPQSETALATSINDLERECDADGTWRQYVNRALSSDYQLLFGKLDLLVLLKPENFSVVMRWRTEQEHKLRHRIRAEGGDLSRVMDDSELRRFIAHYERLTNHILAEMPARADIAIELGPHREPGVIRGLPPSQ